MDPTYCRQSSSTPDSQFVLPNVSAQVSGGDFPLGDCNSYAPLGCANGYASGDIFYLEVCVYDMMCSNRNEMWALNPGDPWACEMEYAGYKQLYQWVLNKQWPD